MFLFHCLEAMATNRNICITSSPIVGNSRRYIGTINILRQTAFLLLLCRLSVSSFYPWEFNNTCEQGREKYGSNCEDEFQKILDEFSILVENGSIAGNLILRRFDQDETK